MGMMTSDELKVKLDAAKEKVEKRLSTIKKLCDKVGVNYDELINAYSVARDNIFNAKKDWMPSKDARDIVANFVAHKETRLPNGDWDDDAYDFNSKVSQLEDNLPKLFDLEKVVKGWQIKYDTEFNKENAPKIQVLVDFLNEWGENAKKWYEHNAERLVELSNDFHKIARDFLNKADYENLSYEEKRNLVKSFNDFMYEEYDTTPRYRFSHVDREDYINANSMIDNFTKEISTVRFDKKGKDDYYSYDQNFGYEAVDGEYVLSHFDKDKLNRVIEAEKKAKYEDLCNRISAVVGEITDVSNLRISPKGNLDGIVKGTKCNAKVETIGAGGWNVQIFHYRVLVNKLR